MKKNEQNRRKWVKKWAVSFKNVQCVSKKIGEESMHVVELKDGQERGLEW